jgi:phosphopantothenoylcysteine synthetase/decarboxylase
VPSSFIRAGPSNKKAKKYYLFLMAGYSEEIMNEARQVIMPQAKSGDEDSEDKSSDEEMSDDDDDEESGSGESAEEGSEESEEDEKIDVKGRKKKDFN